MGHQTPPKQMAQRLARILRPERPEYAYLAKVFQHTRALLAVRPAIRGKRLPHLLTDRELVAFYEAVWQARHPTHMVMIKMLIFTGLRNSELARVRLQTGPEPTLLVKSRRSISSAMEASFSRGVYLVSRIPQRRLEIAFPHLFDLTNRVRTLFTSVGNEADSFVN
jgi:integrase